MCHTTRKLASILAILPQVGGIFSLTNKTPVNKTCKNLYLYAIRTQPIVIKSYGRNKAEDNF